jgi:hypothetical protein
MRNEESHRWAWICLPEDCVHGATGETHAHDVVLGPLKRFLKFPSG